MGVQEVRNIWKVFNWGHFIRHPKLLLRFRFTWTCFRCKRVCLLGRLLIGDKKNRSICATCHGKFLDNLKYELVKAVYYGSD